jgi:hypothetical protein
MRVAKTVMTPGMHSLKALKKHELSKLKNPTLQLWLKTSNAWSTLNAMVFTSLFVGWGQVAMLHKHGSVLTSNTCTLHKHTGAPISQSASLINQLCA